MSEDKKVILSLKNVEVKFNVRGRILTAIRNVSLDIYENEALAIGLKNAVSPARPTHPELSNRNK